MPDPAKHASLVAAGFKIQKSCQTCKDFSPSGGWWGKCRLKTHDHAKHGVQHTGVPPVGHCDDYTVDANRVESLVGPDYAKRYLRGS